MSRNVIVKGVYKCEKRWTISSIFFTPLLKPHRNMLAKIFVLLLLICTAIASEEFNVTEPDPNIYVLNPENSTTESSAKETVVVENSVNVTQRITQPSQHIERTLEATKSQQKKFADFKPSPQLDVEYEYNKFPVVPAFPEAKQFGNEASISIHNDYVREKYSTTEYPWTSKVRFPTTSPERPYKFYNEYEETAPVFTGKTSYSAKNEGFSFNKPVPVPEKPYTVSVVEERPWEKYEVGYNRRPPIPPPQNKHFGFNLMERPANHKTYNHDSGVGSYDKNPWKKIIKILTTFIPIGLIISALTPTVITVTNTNDTSQSRYRLVDKSQELKKKLVTSLSYFEGLNGKGCEERVLCELLLSASSSKNAHENVKNLLDNFSEQEKNIEEKTEDLKKIFAAVKNEDCSPIICANFKNPT